MESLTERFAGMRMEPAATAAAATNQMDVLAEKFAGLKMEGKKFAIKPRKAAASAAAVANPWWPVQTRIPITLGEEVEAALAEWYGTRGLPIPAEEVGIGATIDKQQKEEFEELMRLSALAAGETVEVADEATGEVKKVEPVGPGPKPEFGTPEFWAWARRKRAFDNAERAKQGLPPLPTAKEKAAAKAARAAAKAAKKSGSK